MPTDERPKFGYTQSAAQRDGVVARHPVVVVGAGPVGLTAALDCARRGLPVLLLDDADTVSAGSRAFCFARRTLQVWNRLGVAAPVLERGVGWQVGKVFFRDEMAYQFELQPEPDERMPAMINLQQYLVEEMLVAATAVEPRVTLAWKHRLVGLQQLDDRVRLDVRTPDGSYALEADWLIACDGANSDTRRLVGAAFTGAAFRDRFLVVDVVMSADFPSERWFWFDPPFHRGRSVLLHRQADQVWRIEFQLGRDDDPEEARKPEHVVPRIRRMLGPAARFELESVSVYQFACRRIDRFRHGRVLFAGDAAHQVAPYGARGANSGVQDVDDLAWKLALVHAGDAPDALLDSYHDERARAADDNLLNAARSTEFVAPETQAGRLFRDAVLELSRTEPFARPLVNSGRLSAPTPYLDSPLNSADGDAFAGAMRPGTPCADAPVLRDGAAGWLLESLGGGFVVLAFGAPAAAEPVCCGRVQATTLVVGRDLLDVDGVLERRYDGRPGTVYLIRPDQHVAARWRRYDAGALRAALGRALAA